MHRQGRTDKRTTGRGGEEEEAESEGEGRGRGSEGREKSSGQRAGQRRRERQQAERRKEDRGTCRLKRPFLLPTAPKTKAKPRASVFAHLAFGVVVYLYMVVVAVSQVLAGTGGCLSDSVHMVFHEEGLPVVAINIVVHSFCFLLCDVCSVFLIPYIGLVILCSAPDDI